MIKLVENAPNEAAFVDPNLLNPWGLAFTPKGDLVVANNHSNLISLYKPSGQPTNKNANALGGVTGIVNNYSSKDFRFGEGSEQHPAKLLIATEAGTVLAYNSRVELGNAVQVIDSSPYGAIYKGIAIAKVHDRSYLYVTDFHNGVIVRFDRHFQFIETFTDPEIPEGFAPFNIKEIGGLLYVTYAKQLPPENEDDEPGPGFGYVNIFSPTGHLIKRLISEGELNAPWALAIAPEDFGGKFGGALLVGNFGDGQINAYNPHTGKHLGKLHDRDGNPIVIEGLWALEFWVDRPSEQSHSHSSHHHKRHWTLYFTAGPNDENDGLLGIIHENRHH